MNEIEIIDRYLTNQLQGIYYTENCFFMPVRITGLGVSYRVDDSATIQALQEATNSNLQDIQELIALAYDKGIQPNNFIHYFKVDRDETTFTNLDLYNGMPITIQHPKNTVTNSNSLLNYDIIKQSPIVGTIVKAYQKDNAIWGIGKFYSNDVLTFIDKYQSTSPAVEVQRFNTPNGIKEVPLFVNHLALVKEGHWDSKCGGVAIDKTNLTKGDLEVITEQIAGAKNADSNPNQDTTIDTFHDGGGNEYDENKAFLKHAKSEMGSLNNEINRTEVDKMKELQETEETRKLATEANDEAEKVEGKDEVVEVSHKVEAKDEADEAKAETKDEEIAKEIAKDEAKTAKAEEAIRKANEANSESLEKQAKLEEAEEADSEEEIDSDEETADDKEREKSLQAMRGVCDEVANLIEVKVPYFSKRVNASEAKRVFMAKNSSFVDSKYKGLVSDSHTTKGRNAELNSIIIDEAFNATISNIEAKAKAIKPTKVNRGWLQTGNPNVSVKPNF